MSLARPLEHPSLVVLLTVGMAASVLPNVIVSALATPMSTDLAFGPAVLGVLLALPTAVGAVAVVGAGTIVDRARSHAVLATLLAGLTATMILVAVTRSTWQLAVVLGLGGLVGAAANPATNDLLRTGLPQGIVGVATGIKQSGIQAAYLLGGLLLPSLASTRGWRGSAAATAVLPLVGLALAWGHRRLHGAARGAVGRVTERPPQPPVGIEPDGRASSPAAAGSGSTQSRSTTTPETITDRGLWALQWYALLLGAVTAATIGFIPAYLEQDLAMRPVGAGAVLSTVAGIAIVARTWLTHRASGTSQGSILRLLRNLAAGSAIAMGVVALSGFLHRPTALVLSVTAFATLGLSMWTWNGIATIAIVTLAPAGQVGLLSGRVVRPFFAGLAGGPLVFGVIADLSETMATAWISLTVMLVAASIVAHRSLGHGDRPGEGSHRTTRSRAPRCNHDRAHDSGGRG